MNFILCFGLLSSMFVSVIYGQYYPHRYPSTVKSEPYYVSNSANQNPFQNAHENQGYYQRFTDYGSRKSKPLTQTYNTYSSDNKGKGKGQQNQDKYEEEDNSELDYDSNLDYNDVNDGKDFDPFKFITDSVGGFENFADFGGLGDVGDHFDYNVDYNSQ